MLGVEIDVLLGHSGNKMYNCCFFAGGLCNVYCMIPSANNSGPKTSGFMFIFDDIAKPTIVVSLGVCVMCMIPSANNCV